MQLLFNTYFALNISNLEVREDSGCVDVYPTEKCKEHATNEGYCDDYQDFMEKNCARTCGFCQRKSIRIVGQYQFISSHALT